MTLILSNTLSEDITGNTCSKDSDCPCGSACVGGTCQQLIPAKINIESLVQRYPFWMLFYNCAFFGVGSGGCVGYEGEALSACTFSKNQCNSNTFTFGVTGSVIDSGGHGVGCVPLNWTTTLPSDLTFSWHTSDGMFTGSFVVGYSADGNTDSNGNFKVSFTVQLSNVNFAGTCGPNISVGDNTTTLLDSWDMTVSIPGYVAIPPATSIIQMSSTMCEEITGA